MAVLSEFVGRKKLRGRFAGDGDFAFGVAGESEYQDALKSIAGGAEDGRKVYCAALLVPQPERNDRAIQVIVRGRKVGDISKDDAPTILRALRSARCSEGVVEAVIIGGWFRHHFGIRLNIADPPQIEA